MGSGFDRNRALPGKSDRTESSERNNVESNMSDADDAVHGYKANAENAAFQGETNRACGECTACCTILAVDDLKKGNYQPCVHECGGCAIYDSRPSTCRTWSCGWLLGRIEGDERRRPDKIGLIFNREKLAGKFMTVAIEVWPGAAKESSNAYLLRKMSQEKPIVLREYQIRNYDVITRDPQQRLHILQLIQNEWHPSTKFKSS